MRALPRSFAVLVAVVCLFAVSASANGYVSPGTDTAGATAQAGVGLDQADTGVGGWSNTTPNIAGRPYVKSLSITNGGTTTDAIIAGSAGAGNFYRPTLATNGGIISDVYPFVFATNACRQGQAPADGQCYAVPNRVTVAIRHFVGGGDGWGGGTPANSGMNFLGVTTNPAISATSKIDMVVAFKPGYSSLRWTWANGVPEYWNATVNQLTGGDVRIRFTPKTMPWTAGIPNSCTTIPVSSCGDTSTRPTDEVLMPQVIFSMDTTLNPIFAGTLFTTTGAVIGSLDSSPISVGEVPQLTYGVAAPHLNADGSTRIGEMYAVVPSPILALFNTTSTGFNQTLIPISRAGDPGTFTPTWTQWTAGTNGIDAMLLRISDISFSSPTFVVGRQNSSGNSGSGGGSGNGGSGSGESSSGSTAPTALKVGQKATFAQLLAVANVRVPAGAKTTAKVSTPKVCKVIGKAIRGLAVGTCRGTMTITPKKGKPTRKAFTFKVTKTGKRLPVTLHR